MKLSETISKLTEIFNQDGDMEVIRMTEVDGRFFVEYGCIFDVIQVPDENDNLGLPVVCFMEPIESDDEPTNNRPNRRGVLRLIKQRE